MPQRLTSLLAAVRGRGGGSRGDHRRQSFQVVSRNRACAGEQRHHRHAERPRQTRRIYFTLIVTSTPIVCSAMPVPVAHSPKRNQCSAIS